jgi:acetyl-CoA synthetase
MNNPNKPVEKVYPVLAETARRAHADKARYQAMYEESVRNPDAFWDREAKRLDWIKPFTKVKNTSFDPGAVSIKWFEDGRLNVSVNCIDRHLSKRGDQTAIIFEGDDPNDSRHITYLRDRK